MAEGSLALQEPARMSAGFESELASHLQRKLTFLTGFLAAAGTALLVFGRIADAVSCDFMLTENTKRRKRLMHVALSIRTVSIQGWSSVVIWTSMKCFPWPDEFAKYAFTMACCRKRRLRRTSIGWNDCPMNR